MPGKKEKFKLIKALQERQGKAKKKSLIEIIRKKGAKGLPKRQIKKK